MSTTRRRLLAVVGATGLAGCGGSSTAETTPRSATPGRRPTTPGGLAPGEPFKTADGSSVTVEDPTVRRDVLQWVDGVHRSPLWEDGNQYLLVDVRRVAAEPDPPYEFPELTLETDVSSAGAASGIGKHDPESPSLLRGFPHPVDRTPTTGALVWTRDDAPDVEWTLPDEVVRDLGRTPDFEVIDVDAPRAVEPGEEYTLTVTVGNAGDRDGRFLAAHRKTTDPVRRWIRGQVPKSGWSRIEEAERGEFGEGQSRIEHTLRWPGGTERVVVERASASG